MIATLLIANRGEIACRIIRTARRMGIRTVAVYSEADAGALHVAMADEAHPVGPAPARDSYLSVPAILAAARASGADAVHPGYGFLSEKAGFAQACADVGLIFVGPPASAIEAMGSKSAAKVLMEKAGVPLVPGYHGEDQSEDLLAREAGRIGFPVLIKASAGGGGKGMKVARDAAEFPEQLASAKREAAASFGDDRVLVEKYLTRPRHIEVQVFADGHGNIVSMFERDCSIQRRHQKVIEEAPAPGMTPELRAEMGRAAVEAARAVGYVGAGTVEFIAEDGRFYFMEMNTRLQVEHPVTELVTGLDLVEWQLRVARGETLPLAQEQLTLNGHAMEARLYAEDPQRDFLPQTGTLTELALPDGEGVRVDAGVRAGDSVSIHYDPMIAKVIAWGADRAEAASRLEQALKRTRVVGLATNRVFLAALAGHPAFRAAELDTGFIERHRADLLPSPGTADDRLLALAMLAWLLLERGRSLQDVQIADPHSPWGTATGFRLNRSAHIDLFLQDGERRLPVRAYFEGDDFAFDLPGGRVAARGQLEEGGRLSAWLDGIHRIAWVIARGMDLVVFDQGREHRLTMVDPRAVAEEQAGAAGRLAAPMPGKVIAVRVAIGQAVEKGDPLMVVEAMKMEHAIAAPRAGTVEQLHYSVGDLVEEGAELLVLSEAAQ